MGNVIWIEEWRRNRRGNGTAAKVGQRGEVVVRARVDNMMGANRAGREEMRKGFTPLGEIVDKLVLDLRK